jgi:hypothetical protein
MQTTMLFVNLAGVQFRDGAELRERRLWAPVPKPGTKTTLRRKTLRRKLPLCRTNRELRDRDSNPNFRFQRPASYR